MKVFSGLCREGREERRYTNGGASAALSALVGRVVSIKHSRNALDMRLRRLR